MSDRYRQVTRRNHDGLAELVVAWVTTLEPAGWEGSPAELAFELERCPHRVRGVWHVGTHQVSAAADEAADGLRAIGWRVESRRTRFGKLLCFRRVGRR
jgi:hypothetical protein